MWCQAGIAAVAFAGPLVVEAIVVVTFGIGVEGRFPGLMMGRVLVHGPGEGKTGIRLILVGTAQDAPHSTQEKICSGVEKYVLSL